MISTSTAYQNAIGANSRKTSAKIIFEITDTTAKSDISSLTVTGEADISKKAQTYNEVRDMSGKYATFENDYWIADNSFHLPPKSTESGFEIGWWSGALSQADKTFAITQEVLFTFTGDHSSIGISLTFDKLANVVAEDFTIEALDSSDVQIDIDTVTGNTNSIYVWDQNLTDYRKIKIRITKMSAAYRRARITEVDFGVIQEYTGNELISCNVLEEVDTTSSEVTTNELTFTVDNQNKAFDILNPTGFYSFLERKQQIFAYIGVETSTDIFEYVPCGVYYLSEWASDRGTLTASFTSRDIFEQLGESIYRKAIYADITLETLIDNIMADVGVTDYVVDSSLSSITVKGYLAIMTHREALQMCAVAGECIIYSDRYGVIQVKPAPSTPTGVTIELDNMYNSPQIKLDKLINTIEVNNYTFTNLASEKVYEGTVTLAGTSDVILDYSKPATSVSYGVTGGATVNTATYYTNSAVLNITHTGDTTITLTGTELSLSSNIVSDVDTSIPANEKPLTMKVDNTLINNTTHWRQDPRLESSDIVIVEDEFGQNLTSRITKQEFDFSGALDGATMSKGGNL
jgi:hypothetical protein